MPKVCPSVSVDPLTPTGSAVCVPERFNEYVVACHYLNRQGVLDEIEQEFRVSRRGFQFIDGVIAGLAFFGAAPHYSGLRGLLDEASRQGWSEPLAAVAGRQKLCSQASLSRLLDDIDPQTAEAFCTRLLTDWLPGGQLVDHQALVWRDCQGQPWHGFAIDGRVQPFRRRGLCEGEAYPEPVRSVDKLGARPGYPGRKRADVQMHISILQHMGSSLYLAMNYESGNGRLSEAFGDGLAHIQRWASDHGVGDKRCFLAIDGHAGGFGQLRKAVGSPVHFVTRLAHYEPLKDPAYRARLARQTWQKVADSGSGPTRWATEMGDYHLGDDAVRLVVSCFEAAGDQKTGAGYFADGLQYEVYACDFDPARFPAAEVVTTFYGRAGRQENSFARLDRHMDLEHIYSASPAGQQVMMALGMWMHNFRAVLGAETFGDLADGLLAVEPRRVATSEGLPLEGEQAAQPAQAQAAATPRAVGFEAPAGWWQSVEEAVEARIEGLDGFDYDSARRRIGCAKGVCLELAGIRERTEGRLELRFRIGSKRHCADCPFRSQCTSSESPAYKKEIAVTVDPPEPGDDQPSPVESSMGTEAETIPAQATPSSSEEAPPGPWVGLRPPPAPDARASPRYQMCEPVLVASSLRNAFRHATRTISTTIEVSKPPPDSAVPEYLALTPARRQRRRQTWAERLGWNALPEEAEVNIEIQAPPDAHRLLRADRPSLRLDL